MNKFSVVAKKNEKSCLIENRIKKELIKANWIYEKQNPDFVICVGGDGTLLYAVHKYLDQLDTIKFIGIHTGTLGFFTDYTEDEVSLCVEHMITKEPELFTSSLLKIELNCNDSNQKVVYALNEMRIENIIQTQQLDVYVDGEFFETCRGSGVCLSTQAGSTAYNRSLKAAVIDSGLSVLQLAEITAIQHSRHRSLGNPYIMKEDRCVMMKSDTFEHAIMCYDHLNLPLKGTDTIICTMSNKKVQFARFRTYSYLNRLKNLY